MNDSTPLVSICISTYNRAPQIEKCLDSLVKLPEFNTDKVELVLSNNGSTDNTKEVCRRYVEQYPKIIYLENKENIAVHNFPVIMGAAHGRLRKMCNDTTLFRPDALKIFCQDAEKYYDEAPVLFYCNGMFKASSGSAPLDFESFMYKVSFWITSSVCFSMWDKDCENVGQDFEGCDSQIWQVRKTLDLLGSGRKAIIRSYQYADIQALQKKDLSYGLYQVFYKNYLGFLKNHVDSGELSSTCYEWLRKDLLYHFFTAWIIQWEKGGKKYQYSDKENLKELILSEYKGENYYKNYLWFYRAKRIQLGLKDFVKNIVRKQN